MTNCKVSEGIKPLDSAPFSRAPAHARVHLSDALIAAMAKRVADLARFERAMRTPLTLEQFADRCIRATVGAINASDADTRYRDWEFEKLAIACLSDEQAEQSFARWKGYQYQA